MNKRSILLFNDIKFKKLFNDSNLLTFSGPINKVYYGNVYNPPFFNFIIWTDFNPNSNNSSLYEFAKMIWNMCLLNGNIIIPIEFKNLFSKHIEKEYYISNKKYILVNKNNNTLYVFRNKYRVIDFMIIGVQKSGTTTAMDHLSKHPDIWIAKGNHPGNEMHFYDYHWTKGEDWYKKFFNYNKKLVGEKNPNIIYLDYVFPMIQKMNPCIKMILFLRNPIDRAYSAWHMFNVKNKQYILDQNRKTFEESIEDEINNRLNEPLNFGVSNYHILQRGLYFKQIEKLIKYFPKQNIHISISENVIKNPKNEYEKIYKFLDIKNINIDIENKLIGSYNKKNKNKNISINIKKKLINFFKDDVQKLEEFINYKTNWLK